MLDGHTGYLYFDEPNYQWNHLSFAAPTVEDWLERELDGGCRAQVRYHPQKEKKLAIVLEEGWIRLAEGPRPDLSLQQQPALDPAEARRETMQFREETLSTAGPDPLDQAVDQGVHQLETMPGRLPQLRQRWHAAHVEGMERRLERYEQNPAAVQAQIRERRAKEGSLQVRRSGWRLEQVPLHRPQAEAFPSPVLCHTLQVAVSGYYAWRRRAPSAHQQAKCDGLVDLLRLVVHYLTGGERSG
jgi:hypothetical protein